MWIIKSVAPVLAVLVVVKSLQALLFFGWGDAAWVRHGPEILYFYALAHIVGGGRTVPEVDSRHSLGFMLIVFGVVISSLAVGGIDRLGLWFHAVVVVGFGVIAMDMVVAVLYPRDSDHSLDD